MDDPGWGEYTPLPPDVSSGRVAGGQPQSAPGGVAGDQAPTPPGGGGGGEPPVSPPPGPPPTLGGQRRLLIGAGAVGAVVLIVVLVLVLASGGGHGSSSAAQTSNPPASAAPTTTALLSKADFIAKADDICTSFRSRIEADGGSGNTADLAQAGQAEVDQIRALGPPSQDAALIETMLNDATQAVQYLIVGDVTNANAAIAAADTAAGQFGMHVCNYGH